MPETRSASLSGLLLRTRPLLLRGLRTKRLPFFTLLALLVLIGYLAARLTWQFAAPAATGTLAAPPARGGTRAGELEQGPAARIAAAHLFGTTASSPRVLAENAPETSLDLTLLGVAAATAGGPSRAIIASGANNEQNIYPVGATVPGGAVIRAILPDRVVIAHNGRLESLRLPFAGTSLLAAHMTFGKPSGSPPRQGGNSLLQTSPSRLRQRLEGHPKQISEFLQLRPYAAKGHLQGYRVYPGSHPALFRETGLKPGDIVTSVNGVNLGGAKASMQALSQLRRAHGPIHLVVLRHGESIHLTINVPEN